MKFKRHYPYGNHNPDYYNGNWWIKRGKRGWKVYYKNLRLNEFRLKSESVKFIENIITSNRNDELSSFSVEQAKEEILNKYNQIR
ncbi:MAG: hypothetical protein ACOCV1_06540 [Bacillota bacterium]